MADPSIDVQVSLQFQQAIDQFTRALQGAAQNISVGINASPESFEKIKNEGEHFFAQNGNTFSPLNANSPYFRKDLKEYCDKMTKEMKKQLAQNPNSPEAAILRQRLERFQRGYENWKRNFDSNFELNPQISAAAYRQQSDKFAAMMRKMQSEWKTFDDSISRSKSTTDFANNLRDSLGKALDEAGSKVSGLQRKAQEVSNAINVAESQDNSTDNSSRYQAARNLAGNVSQNITHLTSERERLLQEKERIDQNTTMTAGQKRQRYESIQQRLNQNSDAMKIAENSLNGLTEALNKFSQKTEDAAKTGNVVEEISTKLRDLNMAGVPIPRTLTNMLGKLNMLQTGIGTIRGGLNQNNDDRFSRATGEFFREAAQRGNFNGSIIVTDAQGNTKPLEQVFADAVKKARENVDAAVAQENARRGTRMNAVDEQAYRERFTRASIQDDLRMASRGSGAAERNAARNLAGQVTSGGMGNRLGGVVARGVSKVGGNALINLFKTIGPKLLSFASKWIPVAGWALAIVTGVTKALKALGSAIWAYWNRNAYRVMELTMKLARKEMKLTSGLQITSIQQENQLRLEGMKNALELDKKRVEINRELATASMEMNAADLASRMKILEIDKKSLEAKQKAALYAKQAGMVKDVVAKYDEYTNDMDEGAGVAKEKVARTWGEYLEDWGRSIFVPLLHWKMGWTRGLRQYAGLQDADAWRDEQGRLIDSSITVGATRKFYDSKKRGMAMTNMLDTATETRKVVQEIYKADMEKMIGEYQNFADYISNISVGDYSQKLEEALNQVKDKNNDLIKEIGMNQTQYAASKVYAMSFEEAVKAKVIQKSFLTGHYMFTDEYGKRASLGTEEEAAIRFQERKAQASNIIAQYDDLKKREEALKAEREAVKKAAEVEQDICALMQEITKKQEEVKKQYRTQLSSAISSSINDAYNVQTMMDVSSSFEKFKLELTQAADLSDPRFLRNRQAGFTAEDKEALQWRQQNEKLFNDKKLELDTKRERELQDLQVKNATELFKLLRDQDVELNALLQKAATNIHQASIENLKASREQLFRGLDRQLKIELLDSTSFGKTRIQIESERKALRLEEKFDKIQTELENQKRTALANLQRDWDKEESDKISALQQDQMEEKHKFAIEEINYKADAERALAEAQHKRELEYIKIQVKYRFDLQRLEEQKSHIEEEQYRKALEAKVDKETLNQLAKDQFGVSSYDSLTSVQKDELGKLIANKVSDARSKIEAEILSEHPELRTEADTAKKQQDIDKYAAEKGQELRDTLQGAEKAIASVEADAQAQVKDIQNKQDYKNKQAEYSKFDASLSPEKNLSLAGKAANAFGANSLTSFELLSMVRGERVTRSGGVSGNGTVIMPGLGMVSVPTQETETEVKISDDDTLTQSVTKALAYALANGVSEDAIKPLLDEYTQMMKDYADGNGKDVDLKDFLGRVNGLVYNVSVGKYETQIKDIEKDAEDEVNDTLDKYNKDNNTDLKYERDENGNMRVKYGSGQDEFLAYMDTLTAFGATEEAALAGIQDAILEVGNKELEALNNLIDEEKNPELKKANDDLANALKEYRKKQLEIGQRGLKLEAEQRTKMEETKQEIQRQNMSKKDEAEAEWDAKLKSMEREKTRKSMVLQNDTAIAEARDQMRAEIIQSRSEERKKNMSANTEFAISMGSAKSGVDITKAISKRNSEIVYNKAVADMEKRHEEENFEAQSLKLNESEKRALQSRHEEERAALDNQKQIVDAMRENMGEVGTLRGLISDSVGQKSGLTEAWEKMQAAAFGHIEDPAADATIQMDRNMQLQHAALMSCLTTNLPQLVQNTSTGNGTIQLPQSVINALLNLNTNSMNTWNTFNNILNTKVQDSSPMAEGM